MSEIVFIRHGQASFGSSDYDHLSPIGIQQARVMADHLLALGIGFDAIYSGRMRRQRHTAEPLCKHYSERLEDVDLPCILPAFDEYNARALLVARTRISRDPDTLAAGDLVRLRQDKKAFQTYFSQTVDRWLDGHYDGQEGVEPWPSFCARVRGGVEFLISRHGRGHRIAVFTSGGPISAIMQMALGLSHSKTLEISWEVMNASMTCIKYNSSGVSLSVFNNTTPLLMTGDPALLTYR